MSRHATSSALSLLALLIAASSLAQTTQLYWGDTHVHTSWSVDAFAMGNHFAGPDTAYRFARGAPIIHPRLGTRIQIDRPLDFLVVADHAENLRWQVNTREALDLLTNVRGYAAALELVENNPAQTFFPGASRLDPEYDAAISSEAVRARSWAMQVDAAERNNDPGRFTTLAGWEWSSPGGGSNLHRVIFSPSDPLSLKQFVPYSNAESQNPEDLWDWLDATSASTGAQFVAIPHNSNLSAGYMFAETTFEGEPIDVRYVRQRMRWEPVMEITQVKGTSETHPMLSPNDEFAYFEIYEKLLNRAEFRPMRADYARTALLSGLRIAGSIGANPYKFGFIGSTDSHTGFSTVEENDFFGKAISDTLPTERRDRLRANFTAWEMSAAGLAAVWAEANTRDAITRAFQRREVYATSGPRISLRVFGGFAFDGLDAEDAGVGDVSSVAAVGYTYGIPMGGDLTQAPRGASLQLLIEAFRDPMGANLDRIQVIKGWLDPAGEVHERVYDVAWSGDREVDADGRLPSVGNTVNTDLVRYENSIGATHLRTLWSDPEFDRSRRAFYYVRVLEIPTPRHSLYDAKALLLDAEATGLPAVIQERAWSSPIWYTPDSE